MIIIWLIDEFTQRNYYNNQAYNVVNNIGFYESKWCLMSTDSPLSIVNYSVYTIDIYLSIYRFLGIITDKNNLYVFH
jgi:hypothetical protein